jgi:pyrimidine-nucleoside phosphorylase
MNQPLGRWVGHTSEVRETYDCLEGRGPEDLMEVTYRLSEEVAALVGKPLRRQDLEAAVASGQARERFTAWAAAQGADAAWLDAPSFPLAPVEVALEADRTGVLAEVATRQIGLLLVEAGSGRSRLGGDIDHGVSLRVEARLGDAVEKGQELARLYLRQDDPNLAARLQACFQVAESGESPPLVHDRIA